MKWNSPTCTHPPPKKTLCLPTLNIYFTSFLNIINNVKEADPWCLPISLFARFMTSHRCIILKCILNLHSSISLSLLEFLKFYSQYQLKHSRYVLGDITLNIHLHRCVLWHHPRLVEAQGKKKPVWQGEQYTAWCLCKLAKQHNAVWNKLLGNGEIQRMSHDAHTLVVNTRRK
jgi:hypothetical protein